MVFEPEGGLDKAAWRQKWAAVRDQVAADERLLWSERLCANVENEVLAPLRMRLGRPLTVCVYAAFRSEADPLPLVRRSWAFGDRVVAPRMTDGSMELRIVQNEADWQSGRWGVPEPDRIRTAVLPLDQSPDVVLVPGLAFHRDGSRLGYGGGYYDRFFEAERALGHHDVLWIGFTWSIQLADEPLPQEAHDLRLDALATDNGVIWLKRGGA